MEIEILNKIKNVLKVYNEISFAMIKDICKDNSVLMKLEYLISSREINALIDEENEKLVCRETSEMAKKVREFINSQKKLILEITNE